MNRFVQSTVCTRCCCVHRLVFFFLSFFEEGHVLFQFLCSLQQHCDSAYDKLNSHQQKEFINITKMDYIGERIGD